MARLQTLTSLINSVSTEAEAAKQVKSWLPNADAQLSAFMGSSPGTKNCSLMAEWVATCYKVGVINWEAAILRAADAEINVNNKKLPFGSGGGVLYLASKEDPAHELCVIGEAGSYGLFHAWDGRFELFPKLNGGRDYNITGTGADAMSRILTALTTGWLVMPQCTMASVWDVWNLS